MSILELREDLKKQKDGAAFNIGDVTFYVRRAGTSAYQKKVSEIKRSILGPLYSDSDITTEKSFEINAYILTEYLVSGWDNVEDEEGHLVKYSERAARSIFCNEEYYLSLNLAILNFAFDFNNYVHEKIMEDIEQIKKP